MATILIRTVIIYFFLAFSLKIMGKRQIGEFEVGELVSTLLISEIASIPICDSSVPLLHAIIPVIFILCIEIITSALKNKLPKLKRVVEGTPVYIIYKGKLRQGALRDNRVSINEILSELRTQGIGDISDVEYGILEQNGKVAVIKKTDGGIAHNIIVDGEVSYITLKALGYNEEWLKKRLSERGVKPEEIFLMTVHDSGEINIIKRDIRR